MTLEELLSLEAVLALIVWAGATWRWRFHWYDGPLAGGLLWLFAIAGVIGFSSRSLVPEVALFIVAVIRGLAIVIGLALLWAGPPPKEK